MRRADSLKALTELSDTVFYPIILEACKKMSSDSNPLVRKQALLGILKVFTYTEAKIEDHVDEVKEVFVEALKDHHVMVFETALTLIFSYFPKELALFHPIFKKLVDF